mgnify:CR=1 FL=1
MLPLEGDIKTPKDERVKKLLQAGLDVFRKGDRRGAHDFWREAATVDPYNEQVWLALFRVLETDDDRVVCLRNILAINPTNAEAHKRLRYYEERATGKVLAGTREALLSSPQGKARANAAPPTKARRGSVFQRLLRRLRGKR